ncbi:phosphate butyryltransferase [Virgibacillus sp. L01]|uniref:phosphate butyryltransferase n=1 Tax=Virgibacillus sp. L01 TaxID=3457429 RepID=UPI003FD16ABB
METLTELKQQAQRQKDHVVSVANAADEEVLLAVKKAIEQSLCSFLLVGSKIEIEKLARTVELDLTKEQITIIHVDSNPSRAAVKAVHDRKADILMKGNVSTKDLLKAVLDKECGLRTGGVLSHVALFEIPNQERLVFLTDAAMNLTPTLQEKEQIINNAVQIARGVNISNPNVAVLAAVEVVNPAMQATIDAALLTQMQKRNQIKGCTVDGPLAFDNAVSRKSANHKDIYSDVAGNADILLVPTIEVGNALYKSFMYFAEARVAAVISGAKAPIVLTSRTDSSDSKLNSLSLALVSSKTF